MGLAKYKPIFVVLAAAVIAYIIHNLGIFALGLKGDFTAFYYPLEVLYLFFTTCSVTILFILLQVRKKSLDNVGMTFLVITSIKMVLCYLMVRPILNASNEGNGIEKVNFFMMFILFLAIETIVTIRILNNKQ